MDSVNRTFITMVILTITFFIFTMYTTFVNKKNLTNNEELTQKVVDVFSESKEDLSFDVVESNKSTERFLNYKTDKLEFIFDLKYGSIKNCFINFNNNKYDIIEGNDLNQGLLIKFGNWINGFFIEDKINQENVLYNYEIFEDEIVMKLKLADKTNNTEYLIEKKFHFTKDDYVFKYDINITNLSKKKIDFFDNGYIYTLGWGPKIGISSYQTNKRDVKYDNYGYLSTDKIVMINEKNNLIKKQNIKYAEVEKKVNDSWFVVNSHYYSVVMIPDGSDYNYFFDYSKLEDNVFNGGFVKKGDKSVINNSFVIYIGPKNRSILKKYENFNYKKINISNSKLVKLDDLIFWGLGDVLKWILIFINNFLKNFGLSIIVFTILIKLVLSPLTHKSMESNKKMQLLQPKIKEIQEKYKDKPDLLNKKTMELYSKEGINPFGGCLPLLLQMPILFAMYQLLDRMIDLKGASFLWIKDLSMPDAFQLGFVIPFINVSHINILPIVMVITQILSSMTMPDVQNNKQTAMIMWIMPLMFFFFFYNVASALVLYWTVMNILGIIQQLFVMNLSKKQVQKNNNPSRR